MQEKIKICFVCSGNTCRSPMAEALFKNFLKEKNITNAQISSKGLFAKGAPMAHNAIKALEEFGIKQKPRKSVKLKKCDSKTLYVCMTDAIADELKGNIRKISFSKLGGQIPDPYGLDLNAYIACAKQIKAELNNLFAILQAVLA